MKNFLTLQSVETVLGHLRALPVLPAETVPLTDALGRRLAEALHAPADLPGFDRSTVDGFAVRARDVFGAQEGSPALLECVGDCPMGAVPDISLQPGQCARILTGGMLPEGADCVVMVEYSRPAGGNMVELTRTQAPGDHVVMRDEDAAAGDCIIPAGRKLRPQEIGLLASFGQKDVAVRRAPRVAIISTGDEVVPIGSEPRPGQVRDVNSYSLAALCRSAGAEPTLAGLVRDDAEALRRTVLAALDEADVVVVSGGSSAGMRDHTVDVFTSVPGSELLTHGVAISPGKPFILARSGGKCLMGLPGHVSSALVCARAFLVPLLEHLQGSAGGRARPLPHRPPDPRRGFGPGPSRLHPRQTGARRRRGPRGRLAAPGPGLLRCGLAGPAAHEAFRRGLRPGGGRRPRHLRREPRRPHRRGTRARGAAGVDPDLFGGRNPLL